MAGHCPEIGLKTVTDIENKKGARDEVVHEWPYLLAAVHDVIDAALDIAGKLTSYEEEWDAIENVRELVHDLARGRACRVKVTDLLIALEAIFSTIEIEAGIDSAEIRAPLRALLENKARLPVWIRCPGADSNEKPAVVIRRFPGRRNCAAGFSAIAA
jgi:hypothetical protein